MMRQLLCQADDYGITDAVSAGIRKGIEHGLVRNTGLFTNMPSSAQAARDIPAQACLGQDINFVTGRPLSSPSLIPALVGPDGRFRTSGMVMAASTVTGGSNVLELEFAEDPYPIDELRTEARAQFQRFVELVGHKPAYLHPHSLVTPNSAQAIRELAEDEGVPFTPDVARRIGMGFLSSDWNVKPFPLLDQLATDVEEGVLGSIHEVEQNDRTWLVAHPGFVDDELFDLTTYTMIRAKDLRMFCSPRLREWVEEHDVELITWHDLS